MKINCKMCTLAFALEDAMLPSDARLKKTFEIAKEKFPDISHKSYGEDGFTPVCADCFTKLMDKNPWLYKSMKVTKH